MNKECIQTKSGGIIVLDENHRPREVEYSDNLEEILIQENVIETIENRIEELEEELDGQPSIEEVNKRKYIPSKLTGIIIGLSLSPFIDYWVVGNVDVFVTTVNTILGPMNEAIAHIIPFAICTIPLGAILDWLEYKEHKHSIKEFNAKTIELENLRKQLGVEKATLDELELKKTNVSTNNELKVILVNDQEKLNCFKRRAYFYYNVGYNLDRYYAAYLKGTLDSLLQQEGFTNDEDRAVLVNYTKEKGKVLARKRTKRLKR